MKKNTGVISACQKIVLRKNDGTQTVTLPDEARFPDGVKEVLVRVVGPERVLSPVDRAWDTFFLSEERVTDDLMTGRAGQKQREREPFDP